MPARKFTDMERRELKQHIIEAVIQRLDKHEALTYIEKRMGKPISLDYYHHLKSHYRHNASQRISHLQKDRYAYMQLFFDRIDELQTYQAEQWRIFHENPNKPLIQQISLKELHQLTISIGNYYDLLPSLTSTYVPSYTSSTSAAEATTEAQGATATGEIPV